LSDATLSAAALARESDAKPSMSAPPFRPVAEDVLILLVQRIADAAEHREAIAQRVGDASARQPIWRQPHACCRKDSEVRVDALADVSDRRPVAEPPP